MSDTEIPSPSGRNGTSTSTDAHAAEPAGLSTADLVTSLREALGLPADECLAGERAASVHRTYPDEVHDLDAGGWIAWCMTGLVLFAGEPPSMPRTRFEAMRTVAALAMLRSEGNITGAARRLRISRKVVRDNLRAVGLYPWPPMSANKLGGRQESFDRD